MRRPESGAIAVAALLTIIGISASLLGSIGGSVDPSIPQGTVTGYIRAVQAGDVDRAWNFVTSAAPALGSQSTPPIPKDLFAESVHSNRGQPEPRVRILQISQSADTATVQLEVARPNSDPLSGLSIQEIDLTLQREGTDWKIAGDPMPWAFN